MIRRLAAWAACALIVPASPAWAQAYQCVPPARITPVQPVQPDGPPRRVSVAAYTLAVSWSPEYCRNGRGNGPDNFQCNRTIGRFGFILHGLWPESRSGPPPQWCSTAPAPSPEILRRNLCMTPSARLLAHEWAKHGSCMAPTPDAYFRASAALWQSLHMPDADALSRLPELTVGDVRRAFIAANPGWNAQQLGIVTTRSGWLQELRLCYGRNFRPASCPRRTLGQSDNTPLKIWRGL